MKIVTKNNKIIIIIFDKIIILYGMTRKRRKIRRRPSPKRL